MTPALFFGADVRRCGHSHPPVRALRFGRCPAKPAELCAMRPVLLHPPHQPCVHCSRCLCPQGHFAAHHPLSLLPPQEGDLRRTAPCCRPRLETCCEQHRRVVRGQRVRPRTSGPALARFEAGSRGHMHARHDTLHHTPSHAADCLARSSSRQRARTCASSLLGRPRPTCLAAALQPRAREFATRSARAPASGVGLFGQPASREKSAPQHTPSSGGRTGQAS